MSARPAPGGWCTISFVNGEAVDVRGDLTWVIDEIHRVATRREHTFVVFEDRDGQPVALRPETIAQLRPAGPASSG